MLVVIDKDNSSVIVILAVVAHPRASVTVTFNVPEHRPLAVALVWAKGSSHKKLYGEVPPEGDAIAVPSHTPLQDVFVPDTEITGAADSVTLTEAIAIQPVTSVTVTVY